MILKKLDVRYFFPIWEVDGESDEDDHHGDDDENSHNDGVLMMLKVPNSAQTLCFVRVVPDICK